MSDFFELLSKIKEKDKLHLSFLNSSIKGINYDEKEELKIYIKFLISKGFSLSYLAECYNLLTKDTFIEQFFFKRNGRYRYSTFEQVKNQVYFNEQYMEKYMIGVAISTFLWPNHRSIKRFFINSLPKNVKGNYFEIGPGHGFYFLDAIKKSNFDFFLGIDISEKSVELTRNLLQYHFSKLDNIEIIHADFLKYLPNIQINAIVMGEVLEHVENPDVFMRKIYQVSNDDAFIFITTAINSPAKDHIYLFRSVEEVERLVFDNGFVIKDELVLPYYSKTLQQSIEEQLPINISLVLTKTI